MINILDGNLLNTDVEAQVNTVNTVGVMGKGIALQFKQAYPENYKAYKKACDKNEVEIGKIFVFYTNQLTNPKYILNFPTKRHWREKTKIDYVEKGLIDLKKVINNLEIQTIAIPPLGCGFGGLNWEDVKPIILNTLKDLQSTQIYLFEPKFTPDPYKMKIGTKKPNMTRGRAALIWLMHEYSIPGYRLSILEIQKLAFLLQTAGEPLRLNFKKNKYGPYAENLHFVLQHIEGHFIRGYGDRSSGTRKQISLLPNAFEHAKGFLRDYPETLNRLEKVISMINGFESPYGMELLASVTWLAKERKEVAKNFDITLREFHKWSKRKKEKFKKDHIEIAWKRVNDCSEIIYY